VSLIISPASETISASFTCVSVTPYYLLFLIIPACPKRACLYNIESLNLEIII